MLMLLLAPPAALAADAGGVLTGNQFLDGCEQPSPVGENFCVGYIVGLREGQKLGVFLALKALDLEGSAAEVDDFGRQILGDCMPVEANYRQLRDIALQYLNQHPEQRHESARMLIWSAWLTAFGCVAPQE